VRLQTATRRRREGHNDNINTMLMTTMPSPQTGRMTSTDTIKRYNQHVNLAMATRKRDGRRQDDTTTDDGRRTAMMTTTMTQQSNIARERGEKDGGGDGQWTMDNNSDDKKEEEHTMIGG
jgi:hypothetical protein